MSGLCEALAPYNPQRISVTSTSCAPNAMYPTCLGMYFVVFPNKASGYAQSKQLLREELLNGPTTVATFHIHVRRRP